MSYNGIGLVTPRGSGTSGYVQRNLSALKKGGLPITKNSQTFLDLKPLIVKKPSKKILEHKRKRNIEIKCIKLKEKLENENKSKEFIDKEVKKLREKYEKSTFLESCHGIEETHSFLKAQNERNERLKKALKIGPNHKTGDAFKFEENKRIYQEKQQRFTAEEMLKRRKKSFLGRKEDDRGNLSVLQKTKERYGRNLRIDEKEIKNSREKSEAERGREKREMKKRIDRGDREYDKRKDFDKKRRHSLRKNREELRKERLREREERENLMRLREKQRKIDERKRYKRSRHSKRNKRSLDKQSSSYEELLEEGEIKINPTDIKKERWTYKENKTDKNEQNN